MTGMASSSVEGAGAVLAAAGGVCACRGIAVASETARARARTVRRIIPSVRTDKA